MRKSSLFISIILVLLSGCTNDEKLFNKNNNSIDAEFTAESIIKSEELNFSISVPKKLNHYYLEIDEDNRSSGFNIKTTYSFLYPTKDINWPSKNGYVSILKIMIYEHAEWIKLLESTLSKPEILKTTTEFVYTYDIAPNHPKDININKADLQSLIKSFRLLKNNEIEPIKPFTDKKIPQGDD